MNGTVASLAAFNKTEMLEIIRRATGRIAKRSLPIERIREIVEHGQAPRDDELAGTMRTRYLLQGFVSRNWVRISSQIPCEGTNRGSCTVYGCPEGRHVDCMLRCPATALV